MSSSVVPTKLLRAISCPHQATKLVPAHQLSSPSYYELISCPHLATTGSSVVPTKLLQAHQLSPSSYYELISCPYQATTSSSVVPIKPLPAHQLSPIKLLLPAHQLSPSSYYELISCPHQAVGAAESRPSTQKRTIKTLLKKEQVRLANYHMLMCLNKF